MTGRSRRERESAPFAIGEVARAAETVPIPPPPILRISR